MTRDELIARRKRKKRARIISLIVLTAAAVGVGTGIAQGTIQVPSVSSFFHSKKIGPTDEIFVPGLDEESFSESAGDLGENVLVGEPNTVESKPVATGWQSDSEGRYYLDQSGQPLSGLLHDEDGYIYLLNSEGRPLTGWQEPDIGRVYLDSEGHMSIGLTEIDGKKYYFGYDGVNLNGWQDVGTDTYYFSKDDGAALTGWQTIRDTDCFFNEEGIYDPTKKKAAVGDGPVIALTFDDGPGVYTDELLDILEENNVKATFFMLGELVDYFSSSVKREHDLGMEQGNHSWDHKTLTKLSPEAIYDEIARTNDVIETVTGDTPTVFRPPGGGVNNDVYENSCDMPLILWSIDTLDWQTKNAEASVDCVLNEVKDGSIILMHEIYQSSVDAARIFIPELLERGYQFVTISELAEIKGVSLTSGHSYSSF